MSIRIFVTGGTFDKEYNEITGQLFFKETHLPEMITRSRVSPQVTVTTLMMIDSLDMKPIDRELIANHCINTPDRQNHHYARNRYDVHHGGHPGR